jgi:hypothetical protein
MSIDMIELKAADETQIDRAARALPGGLTPYFEISDVDLLPAIRAAGARAKIRTGGVTPEAFPPAENIARFLAGCAKTEVAFKATAGLHHPLRCHRPLTYSPDGPSGWMFGFLNVFTAAVLAHKGLDSEAIEPLLTEESLSFTDDAISWSGHRITAAEITTARHTFAISFGSCSFEEPVADLKALRLLS